MRSCRHPPQISEDGSTSPPRWTLFVTLAVTPRIPCAERQTDPQCPRLSMALEWTSFRRFATDGLMTSAAAGIGLATSSSWNS